MVGEKIMPQSRLENTYSDSFIRHFGNSIPQVMAYLRPLPHTWREIELDSENYCEGTCGVVLCKECMKKVREVLEF